MKIIDLLNKIANKEELPKKIRLYNKTIYILNHNPLTNMDYYASEHSILLKDIDVYSLNYEVEIIEDKHKKIELLEINKDTGDNYYIVDFETRRHLYFGTDECEQKIIEQQNNIAKAINYLSEKSDKDE